MDSPAAILRRKRPVPALNARIRPPICLLGLHHGDLHPPARRLTHRHRQSVRPSQGQRNPRVRRGVGLEALELLLQLRPAIATTKG